MFKIFAILCTLTYPEDSMGSELACKTFYEENNRTFVKEEVCYREAELKLNETLTIFTTGGVDFKSIQVGCEKLPD